MKRTKTELKAELMQQAELLVDKLLDWTDETERPTLAQIEDIVLKLRQQMGAGMAKAVIEAQAASRPVPGPRCPKCGQEMHYKDTKQDTVTSRVGELGLQRGYYYCERCRAGSFPPGSATGGERYSLE
jgi:hypothetical protein